MFGKTSILITLSLVLGEISLILSLDSSYGDEFLTNLETTLEDGDYSDLSVMFEDDIRMCAQTNCENGKDTIINTFFEPWKGLFDHTSFHILSSMYDDYMFKIDFKQSIHKHPCQGKLHGTWIGFVNEDHRISELYNIYYPNSDAFFDEVMRVAYCDNDGKGEELEPGKRKRHGLGQGQGQGQGQDKGQGQDQGQGQP